MIFIFNSPNNPRFGKEFGMKKKFAEAQIAVSTILSTPSIDGLVRAQSGICAWDRG